MWIDTVIIPEFARGIEPTTLRSSTICSHPKHELFYLINGTTNYIIDGKRYSLRSGEMVFIPKGTMHSMSNKMGIDNERLLLSFDDDIIPEEYKSYIQYWSYHNLIYIPPKHIHEIEKIFQIIESEYKSRRPHYQEMVNLCILQLLMLIDRFHTKPPKPVSDETNLLVNDVAKYIQTNFRSNINLDTLCETFTISKSYLSRRFKTVFGIGINDYITYIRLLHAEKLLSTTDYPITQIAAECGYSDSNYFSTAFKKFKGMTARQFRNEQTKH